MKYFYVIANLSKDYVLDVQDEVQNCLEKRGAVCRFMTDYERMKNGRHTPSAYVPTDTQCIITIGGDGTLIQAARDLAGRNIPMLGINRGHLGFLNQVDSTEDIDAAMDALVNDRFRLERRMMLRGTVFHEGKPVFQDISWNAASFLVKRAPIPRSVSRWRSFLCGRNVNEACLYDCICPLSVKE